MSGRGILHQLIDPDRPQRCFDRCRPCDALLLAGPGAELARQGATTLPDVAELWALQTDIEHYSVAPTELAPRVQVIDDDEWVAVVARFELNIVW